MTGSNESMFLNTIKSRCMKIYFSKIPDKVLTEFLKKNYNINLENDIIKACEGSIEKAINVFEKKDEYEETLKIFSNIESYKLLDIINKLNFIYENKQDIFEILDYINIILSKKIIENPKYINYIDIVEKAKRNLKLNANYDMSIDNMIYNIWNEQIKNIEIVRCFQAKVLERNESSFERNNRSKI